MQGSGDDSDIRRPASVALLFIALALLITMIRVVMDGPAHAQAAPTPDLVGSEWLLQALGGSGVIDGTRPTVAFPERGKVVGHGSCNRFTTSVQIEGTAVSFGPIAATRMHCADAISDQEQRYFTALGAAKRLVVDGAGLSIYANATEIVLRFTRPQK